MEVCLWQILLGLVGVSLRWIRLDPVRVRLWWVHQDLANRRFIHVFTGMKLLIYVSHRWRRLLFGCTGTLGP